MGGGELGAKTDSKQQVVCLLFLFKQEWILRRKGEVSAMVNKASC